MVAVGALQAGEAALRFRGMRAQAERALPWRLPCWPFWPARELWNHDRNVGFLSRKILPHAKLRTKQSVKRKIRIKYIPLINSG